MSMFNIVVPSHVLAPHQAGGREHRSATAGARLADAAHDAEQRLEAELAWLAQAKADDSAIAPARAALAKARASR